MTPARTVVFVLAAVVPLAVALAASGSRLQLEEPVYWLIYDGRGAGTMVATLRDEPAVTGDGPRAVPHNATIRADGHLQSGAPPHPPTWCTDLHYHGQLFGEQETGPERAGCGWGRVMPYGDASYDARTVSEAATAEQQAKALVTTRPGRTLQPAEARRLLALAMAKLEELELKYSHRRSLAAKARGARTFDRVASDALGRLEQGQGDPATNQGAALEALDQAAAFKRDLFAELAREGLLLAKDDKCKQSGGRALAIVGTDGPDVIRGTRGPDLICAGAGNDRISGLGGNDILLGGDGNDVIDAGAGNDIVSGGIGNDRILGGAGVDTIRTGPGADRVTSGAGRDIVDGKRERKP